MKPVNWSKLNLAAVALNWMTIMVLGLAFAFLAQLLRVETWNEFNAMFTLFMAFLVFGMSYRLGMRERVQPMAHGLLLGLLVALANLVLSYLTIGLGIREVAAFLMHILAGALGGRMAFRVMEGPRR
ncbi:MAG: hypothetical protein ABTQ73_08360 [Caldilineales bacterium]